MRRRHVHFRLRVAAGLTTALALAGAAATAERAGAAVLPTGFQESTVFSGLSNPTAVRFAADGRIFVAEKNGRIKVFDSLADSSPTLFADLSTNVYNFWDRGMLGMALAPDFPADPHVYVLYTHDAAIGGTAPRWGTPGVLSDPCPSPPGPTSDGCVVSGRLSRLTAAGNVMTGNEHVLIEDWCQQYPSHSVGSIAFGADGALYVTGGDGASFNFTDWGQDGSPVNPCGDPPGGVGAALTPPTAQGGALRSPDLRTSGDPVTLDGAVLRVDPATGQGLPSNPLGLSGDPNARRIVAEGLRNPFRMTIRPGTSEVWLGDVGWNTWEEINRVPGPTDGTVDNFGWPCREGVGNQSGYDSANLSICEDLYSAGANSTVRPYHTYDHGERVVPGEACPTGSSAVAGLAFYTGGSYPDHDGGLFFADNARDCIWFMRRGVGGLPDPAQISTFASDAANPVDIQIGPGGDLFYVDFDGGTVRRIRYTGANQAPTAVAQASPLAGPNPLTVNFDGRSSSDPENGTLTYAWDLDDDGAYDDSSSAQPSFTYDVARTYTVRLRVTDPQGAIGTDVILITAGNNSAPVPTISSPSVGTSWRVGDLISFSGSATDAEDGLLPPSALSWELLLQHCPSNCHTHPIQEYPGVAGGSFNAPDHEYPSFLELKLTATDSNGARTTTTLPLNPRTVDLTFQASHPGLQLTAGASTAAAPFTTTVIVGSANSISAPSPQGVNGRSYAFAGWSDGGDRTHNIVAPATPTTYTATFEEEKTPPVAAYGLDEGSGSAVTDSAGANHGTIAGASWAAAGRFGGALSFDGVDDRVAIPDASALDLTDGMTLEAWVRPSALGTRWRTALFKAQAGNLVYGLYANRNTTRPVAEAHISGAVRQANGTGPLPLNAWSHVASTYDGTTLRLFIDGAQVSATAVGGAMTVSSGELWIGGNPVWPEWFAGLIDEIRIYNRALGAAEIQTDMELGVGEPDGDPPSAPGSLTATGGIGSVDLDWTAATDNTGVHHYNVHRSTAAGFTPSAANRIAQPTGTSYADSGLQGAQTYYYRVTAEDAVGNVGAPSNEASATSTADTTAPAVAVTAPAGGATVSGTVALTATASDDDVVAGVQFEVDGADAGSEDTSAPYSLQWDSRSVANGDHDITAVARDPSGNVRTSDSVRVSVNNSAEPPPDGLVAAYGFDEGVGGAVTDSSGTGNDGAITEAARTTAGRFGGALSFDGVNDRVVVPDASSLDLTSGMTLEAWVRPAALASKWRTAVVKESGSTIAYALYANRNTNVPNSEVLLAGRIRAVNGPAALPLDTWTHLASTYDGNTLRLYVNGSQVATMARVGTIGVSAGALSIGGNAVHGEWFQGLLDELRVYDRPLTAAEIQADMNRSIGTPDTEDPTAPGNLTATGGRGTVALDWTAATDNAGIRRYRVHRSTTPGFAPDASNRIAEPTGTAYTDAGLAANTYYYRVIAEDLSGRTGPASNEASGTATADTLPPTVAITAPADGTTVSGTVTVSANASDDDAVASVQFKVGGADIGSPDAVAPYSVQWDTRLAANGGSDLTAVALDRSGNPATSAPVHVTVDNSAAPPPAGLVAAYAFDEGGGATAGDASGTGNHGAVNGATWVAGGRFGGALSFDGLDDRVVVPDAGSLDLTTGMTVSAWIRPTALGTAWRTVLFKAQASNLVYGLYAHDKTRPRAEAFIGGSVRQASAGAALPLNAWSHLTMTYDGAVLRSYLDGTQIAATTIAGAITTSTGELWIGGNPVWPEWFAGSLDEIRVYNRALTAAEIQAEMTSAAGAAGGAT